MHLETEQVERLLHGELEPGQESVLRAHVRKCPLCERRLERASAEEEEIFHALRRLDHPVPPISLETITAPVPAGRASWRRTAAGIALVIATTGALYAFPGSPLPGLLRTAPKRADPEGGAGPAASQPYASGVAVDPGESIDLVFESEQEHGIATVRLVDARELGVRALGEPITFDVGIGRLTVANRGAAADYVILIPRSAPSVRIHVGAELVLRKDRDGIHAPSGAEATETYRLPLTLPPDR